MSATILVVDDEAVVRDIATRLLEEAGYSVLCAEDGAHGVRLFREHSDVVRAVVSDINMPEMSGRQLFQTIHRLRPDVPFLFCSGTLDSSTFEELADMRPAVFLSKPYRKQEFLEAVGMMVTESQGQSS